MTMSGVYTSRGNFDFDRNVVGWFSPFQPGDVISWSFTTSGTSPYVHIQLANELNTPYPSSALNRTGSGSGSFTVQTATDYVNISAMPLQLDANGDVINSSDNPAMYNRTATITVSCTPAGSATPTVTSLSPTTGSVLGGTTVTLTGTNLTGITNVSFGGTAATDITGNTATSVTVRTPAHAAGAVNVVATASAGSTTVTNGFTYAKAAQTITFADPGAQNFGAAPTLTASASSGLALAFTSATTGVCTISSAGVLTFVTVGTCTINADQAGDATYQAATTVSRSFAVNAVAPGAPTIGTATAGDGQATLTFTAPTSTGGATITGYEVTISPGNTVVTGASSPITIPNLTNGTAYSFTVKAINSAGSGPASAASNTVTPVGPLAPPTVGAVTATVNANSSGNAITLVLSGGAATSVAVASAPRNGTATASGTSITYTPMTNYRGSDSFTYTATNASGTSAPATVTIDVAGQPAVITSHPQDVRTTVGGSATFSVSATNAASYWWQAHPPQQSTFGNIAASSQYHTVANAPTLALSGVPALFNGYVFRLAVTGTDGQTVYSNSATLQVSAAPVVTSVTPAAGPTSGGTAITITGQYFTGATAVTIGGNPVTSFSVVSATSITAVVPAGNVGPADVVVINPDGTGTKTGAFTYQAPAVVMSPAAGALPGAVVGTAFSQTVSASGGTAPFTYAVTTGTLPAGLSLDPATGAIVGTPTVAGSYSFTVTATDAANQTASAAYTLAVAVQAPVAGAVSTTVAANSTAHAVTLALSGGTATSVAIVTAPAHGTATASGTGIVYTPTAGYSGSDSFTYTATNASGTSAPATVTITVNAPTLVVAPASGPLPAATVGTAYGATLTSTGGTAPYGYSATGLPAGITLAADGTLSGTPTTAGNYTVTIAVTDANGAIGTATYTLEVSVQTPVAGAVSTTVAANSTANAVTLALSGGTATSVAVVTAPTHGTATVSGTGISYTPSAGYSGSDSFTYTATNASGTSAPATVTVTVTAPTLVVAPASGPLPAATVGTAYTATLTSSGGTAPYGYTATGLPAGVTLASNGTLSGTPTTAGSYTVTVAVTDVSGATGTATYTLTVAVQAPVAGAVSTTVVANSTANAVTLALSGGAATSVAVATTPAHGTATVSGTDISYTPSAGYSGSDSFTYTATNASGTSAPATVTVTVTAPTLVVSPASGPLPSATVGTAYSTTLASTGGTAPYGYSATDLPAAITLAADGTLSGTPTTAGNYTVTIAVTDANGATGTATYTLAVNPPPPPVAADPVTTSVAANTQTEAGKSVSLNLSSLVTGQFDDIRIVTQPAHGTVTISRTLAMRGIGGSPLMAMAIAMSSVSVPGQIIAVYTPEAGYQGTDTFQYVAVGPGGTSAPATATIQVVGTAPTAKAITASATDGQPISVDLTAAASGGAFTAATVTSVSPADQATATIVAGGTAEARTFLLKVTPKARFNGMIEVGYTIANVFGTSAPAMVTINVTARPDPSQDAKVGAMSDAQAEAARRFSRAQVANFMSHAEALHGAECGRSTNGLRLGSTDMPSTSHMPGQPIERSLSERDRRRASAGETSEQDERRNEGREVAAAGCSGRVGVWSGGTIDIGTRDATTGRSKVSATTSGISAGVDLHVAKGLTLGIGGGLGHDRSTIAGGAGKVNSDSQVVAIYGSATPMQGWFVDGMLAHGWLDYSLRRLDEGAGALATADRSGSFSTGALSSGIDRSTGALRWSVYGRAEYLNGRLNRYIEEGAGIYNLRFDDRDLRSVTGALGVRLAWQRPLPFGVLTGRLRTEWLHEFTSGTRQGLDYADVAGPSYYSLLASGWSREQFMVAPGIGLTLSSGWDVGLDVGVRAADGERAATTGVQVRKKF